MNPPPPLLFRFSKRQYLEDTLIKGIFRFSHARTFNDSTLASGQQDDEQHRNFSPDASRHIIAVSQPDGSNEGLTNIFDIKLKVNLRGRTGKPLDYYIFCLSLEYKKRFYEEDDFDADSCLRINNPEQLSTRLETAFRKIHPTCDFYGRDCFYYNPSNLPTTLDQKDLVFAKHQDYLWQSEFRVIFAIHPDLSLENYYFVEIGSIEDIAEFYDE